jgi:hypothetical protein
MERRKLLQALTAIPVMLAGKQVGVAYETKPDKRYVVFINAHMVEVDSFCQGQDDPIPALPEGTRIHAVLPNSYQEMDDICRIYEVEKT